MADMKTLPEGWEVLVGEGTGEGTYERLQFQVFQGGRKPVAEESKPVAFITLEEAHEREIGRLKEAHLGEIGRLKEAHLGEIGRLKEVHLAEIGRLEERLLAQHQVKLDNARKDYESKVEALKNQHEIHSATQTRGTEQALRELDEGHQEMARSANRIQDELVSALQEENAALRSRLSKVLAEKKSD